MNTDPTYVGHLSIEIRRQEILRLLGMRGQENRLREDILKLVREAEVLGHKLVRPQGIYRILQGDRLKHLAPLHDKELAALGLCTIGPQLEERVTELMASGREPEGYILDAVGSVAAEATADAVNTKICGWAMVHHLTTSPRFSPGYGNWSLDDQRVIFHLLPAGKIGVRLNPSCMMIPRKSVSFAITFHKERDPKNLKNPCERCGLENCSYRKKRNLSS